VGRSRFAVSLRRELRAAAADAASPVLFRGEPGLQKDRLAALVHFGSRAGHAGAPLARLDCQALKPRRLFGLASDDGALQRPGALDWLAAQQGGGTLLLVGVHALPAEQRIAVAELLALRRYRAVDRHGAPCGEPRQLPDTVRLLLTSDAAADDLEAAAGAGLRLVRVPPLRVRRADLAATAAFCLRLLVRERGRPAPAPGAQRGAYPAAPALSRGATHLLESADFELNDDEMALLVKQALAHAAATAAPEGGAAAALAGAALPATLDADMLWSPAWTRRLTRTSSDLFAAFPALRQLARSAAWPDALNWGFTVYAFPVIVLGLLFGPQEREHNAFLVVFWAWWWPLILVTYPLVGRLWCAVCPFMLYGELAQKAAVAAGRVPGPWPREAAEKYGAWFLYALFAAILMWEEMWRLPDSAALSGALLLLITAGAVACSVAFERRFWCRYLCPIGGMNGMFAKLAVVELRAARGVCTAECSSYGCVRGGAGCAPSTPGGDRGLATAGCPLQSHPANLTDNRDCTLCGSCVKACPHGSVELRLRPPGADLWSPLQRASAEEIALMFLLLGAVGVHRLERAAILTGSLGLDPDGWAIDAFSTFGPHAAMAALLLAAPGLLAWGADGAVCAAAAAARAAAGSAAAPPPGWAEEGPDGARAFVRLAYGWIPLIWAASLAHYLQLFGSEAGSVLPAAADLLHLPRSVHDAMPSAALAPPVVAFLQAAALTVGGGAATALTIALGRTLGVAPGRVAAQCAGIFAAGLLLWPLIVDAPFLQ
jgi:polyferredoxin